MNSGDTTMTNIQTQNDALNNQNNITRIASGGEQLQKQIGKSKKTKKVFKKEASVDIYQEVTDQMIELLELHVSDWVKSWSVSGLPVNISSSNNYRGINVPLLGCASAKKGFDSNVWGTYKQWADKGGQVKQGEKGTMAVFYKSLNIKDDETDEEKKIPMLRRFVLFNSDQVDGVEVVKPVTFINDTIEAGQAILSGSGADIRHGGSVAFYTKGEDYIAMPDLERFHSSTDYYLTAFHELTHWTAHKSRLDRNMSSRFGDNAYALEELIAEMGSAFLAAHTGLSVEPREDHAKYLNSWLNVLKADKKAIFTAASKAQAASDFILNIDCVN